MKRLDLRSQHQKRQDAITSALITTVAIAVFCLFVAYIIIESI